MLRGKAHLKLLCYLVLVSSDALLQVKHVPVQLHFVAILPMFLADGNDDGNDGNNDERRKK